MTTTAHLAASIGSSAQDSVSMKGAPQVQGTAPAVAPPTWPGRKPAVPASLAITSHSFASA